MEKIKALIGALIVLAIGIGLIFNVRSKPSEVSEKRVLLDTYVTITVYSPEDKAKKSINKAFSVMKEVEKKLNRYDSSSEISKINRNAGKTLKVSSLTYKTLKLAQKYNRLSYGYYDITVGKVVSLWDFNKREIPGPSALNKARTFIKPNGLILLSGNRVRILKGMVLDLGSVLKGVAVDQAQASLKKSGIDKALITTGSSTTLIGTKPNSEKWQVGIQHPRKPDTILAVISGNDVTISTSGDYQQYFYKNGRRYNHIINPKTGYPQDDFMSVTVISSKKAADTDILSTAVFASGKKYAQLIAKKSSIDYLLIDKNGRVMLSPGAKKYVNDSVSY